MVDRTGMQDSRETEISAGVVRLWLLQGKTAGDNAQVLALGESLASGSGWQGEIKTVAADFAQAAKHRRLPAPEAFAASGMTEPWPDVIIACGGSSCIVAQWIKQFSGGHAAHVELARLGGETKNIDFVANPREYG